MYICSMEEKKISLNLLISLTDINQVFAMLSQPLLMSEDDIKPYEDLSLNISESPIVKNDVEVKMGLIGFLMLAKETNDKTNETP
jgi:hypothetical protein